MVENTSLEGVFAAQAWLGPNARRTQRPLCSLALVFAIHSPYLLCPSCSRPLSSPSPLSAQLFSMYAMYYKFVHTTSKNTWNSEYYVFIFPTRVFLCSTLCRSDPIDHSVDHVDLLSLARVAKIVIWFAW